jgi:hypothetical protein
MLITNEPPDRPFIVEASTNLIDWTGLASVATNRSPVEIRDSDAIPLARRFYRARTL